MRRVFVDTVALIALWDENDQWHNDAVAAFARVQREGLVFATSSLILLEVGNAIARKPYRNFIVAFRERMLRHQAILAPSDDQLERAWQNYERRFANAAGIVDQVSIVLMQDNGIEAALTNDQHFGAAGIEVLMRHASI